MVTDRLLVENKFIKYRRQQCACHSYYQPTTCLCTKCSPHWNIITRNSSIPSNSLQIYLYLILICLKLIKTDFFQNQLLSIHPCYNWPDLKIVAILLLNILLHLIHKLSESDSTFSLQSSMTTNNKSEI